MNASDLPQRVRSTFGDRSTHNLHWMDDDIHPYVILERWIFRVVPGGGAFTQRANAWGNPVGKVKHHPNLAAALADFGWEPCS